MSNSSLVSYTKISPNKTSPRTHAIDTISIHCTAGQVTVESLGAIFAPSSVQASSNYGIAKDGKIGMYVEEKDRSWCTSSASNDHRAITIEVSSDATAPYKVTDAAYKSLIELCADICKRNGIKKLLWKGDKSLIGQVDKQNMTVHRWFAAKACPGDYLYNLHSDIAAKVNAKLGVVETATPTTAKTEVKTSGTSLKVGDIVTFTGSQMFSSASGTKAVAAKPGKAEVTIVSAKGKHPYHLIAVKGGTSNVYGWVNTVDIHEANPTTTAPVTSATSRTVKVTAGALNIRSGAGTNYAVVGSIHGGGIYTITEVKGNWGKLKSGAGWICLDYTKTV